MITFVSTLYDLSSCLWTLNLSCWTFTVIKTPHCIFIGHSFPVLSSQFYNSISFLRFMSACTTLLAPQDKTSTFRGHLNRPSGWNPGSTRSTHPGQCYTSVYILHPAAHLDNCISNMWWLSGSVRSIPRSLHFSLWRLSFGRKDISPTQPCTTDSLSCVLKIHLLFKTMCRRKPYQYKKVDNSLATGGEILVRICQIQFDLKDI